MTYYDIIQKALNLYVSRDNYAYFYGAKGKNLTDDYMYALEMSEAIYFSQYDANKLHEIENYSRGKIGIDCSGFINLLTGDVNYSSGYWQTGTDKTTPREGTEGNMLYTTFGGTGRHIGLDIGYGYFMHCPKEGRTLEIGRISDYKWEGSAHFRGVDYTGAKT